MSEPQNPSRPELEFEKLKWAPRLPPESLSGRILGVVAPQGSLFSAKRAEFLGECQWSESLRRLKRVCMTKHVGG